ncbi:MAG: hypothetical protein EBY39_14650 [Flavobacteriia bacterium]|nr:hypothetical protein [Flavobacteriia bacterium]
MDQDFMSQVSFIVDMTGSYTQLIITSMSNQMLVFGFTGLIILVFINYYFRMLKDTTRALKTLKKLRVILEKAIGRKSVVTVKEREEAQIKLRSMLKDSSFLKSVEESQMLNWWEQISQSFTYEVGGNKVYTSTDFINTFLNFDKFITAFTSRSVISAPSILTGLGIIGTFLGLSIGVGSASSGLASPDISVARNAMSQLLEGAQLAFLTSLTGLLFALIIRLSFTSRSERIRLKIEEFNHLLSSVAIPKDSGNSGLAALVAIQKNTDNLSGGGMGFKKERDGNKNEG